MSKGLQFWMQILLGLGIESVQHWLQTDIVGCLQKIFVDCQKGDHLKDPEVVLLQVQSCSCTGGGCKILMNVCFVL